MRSPADGHCLIHSILSCLRAKYRASELSINDLLCKLENECYENVDKYMPYFDGDYISFFNLLLKYVDAKSYNTSFCDLVPIIMSNVLDEVIVIIDENIDDNFVTVLSPRTCHLNKRRGTSLGIFLLKTSDHYDACIPAHSTDLNVNSPTLAGHCVNSLDLRTHEYNNGNVPAIVHHHSLAINANTTTQVSHRIIDLPGDFTGGLGDNSVHSNHDDDVTDRDSAPVSIDHAALNESVSSDDIPLDTIPYLDTLRTKYPRNIFIAHLNVNSIRYKFYEIHDILNGNRIDIFGLSETKIDASFTDAQFCIEGFKLYRQDRNSKGNGGGIFVYIKDSIPHRMLKTHSGITNAIEYMSFEICFKRRKWFIVYMYKPPKVSHECARGVLSQLADHFVDSSNLTIFFGDINYDMFKDNILHDLCDVYDLKNVIRGPTCFKGENPTLLDVFLTNKPNSFCNCINIDTGISDFHNLTGVISKVHAPQSSRRRITYRSMKYFDQEAFNRDLSNVPFHVCDVFDDVDDIAWAQQHLLSSVINFHAPLKHRFLRTNQVPYMNGQLRKAIHQRNMWRNKHFKDKRNSIAREKYVHHRNNVVKLTKSSVKTYFKNKCESCHGNSKQFFKTVKPFLCKNSNSGSGNKILLNENGRIVSDASEVAEIFNAFYGSIAGYPVNCDDGLNDISLTNAITKHCLHESFFNIKLHMGVQTTSFDFHEISMHNILEKIKSLKTGKSPGYDGIQVKFLKLADANLAGSLCKLFNKCVESCTFPTSMKMADISPIYKKLDNLCKNNYRSVNLLSVLSK